MTWKCSVCGYIHEGPEPPETCPVRATDLHNPNFADYAEICGAKGFRVKKMDGLEAALNAALAHSDPALVEIISDPELT